MSNIAPSTVPIQIESIQTGNPVSESSLSAMGGAINYMLLNKWSVGDIMMSALDQATFQSQRDTTWVLCDGRSVIGSQYQALTSLTNIPDLRGRFPRGKDNGAGIDPHGDLPIGTLEADQFASHRHSPGGADPIRTDMARFSAMGSTTAPLFGTNEESLRTPFNVTGNTDYTGGSETNPKASVVNFFIKIN